MGNQYDEVSGMPYTYTRGTRHTDGGRYTTRDRGTSRGRGSSRGRRLPHYSRGRSNNASRSSAQSLHRRDDDILRTILRRLDQLERRPATRRLPDMHDDDRDARRNGDRTHTPHTRPTFDRTPLDRTDRRPIQDRTRSDNPDFRRLVKTLFQHIQLSHHVRNWTSCPKSIQKNIDHLTNLIRPPLATDRLRRELQQAADDFKSSITASIQTHLHSQQDITKRHFTDLHKDDFSLACDIAVQQMHRRLGKRFHTPTMNAALDELSFSLTSHTDSDNDWQTVRRRRTTGSVLQHQLPPPTGRRSPTETFSAVVLRSSASDSTPNDLNAAATAAEVTANNVAVTTSSRPPSTMSRRASNSANDAQPPVGHFLDDTEPLADISTEYPPDDRYELPPPPPSDVHVHPPEAKSTWHFPQPKSGMRTLLVTDSNGLSMAQTALPRGCTLEVFRGAGLQHLPSMLNEASTRLADIKTVVVAVGLNNRLSSPSDITSHLLDIRTWARNNNKRIAFSAIPIIPSLPHQTKAVIQQLNQIAYDIFDNLVESVDESDIVLLPHDSSGLHYNKQTAELVTANIVKFLNQ